MGAGLETLGIKRQQGDDDPKSDEVDDDELTPEIREELLGEMRVLIEGVVQPGYSTLAETVAELAVKANDDHGVWKHPEGDAYYRVTRPGHNLDRTRTQLRLVESLESQDAELRRIVDAL